MERWSRPRAPRNQAQAFSTVWLADARACLVSTSSQGPTSAVTAVHGSYRYRYRPRRRPSMAVGEVGDGYLTIALYCQ